MTLYWILDQILPERLFSMLANNFFEMEFEDAEQILNNEISIWISSLESMYPITLRKMMFIKPDYNEAMFYEIKYKHESNSISVDDVWTKLKPSFILEKKFLNNVVTVLTQLLNHKGSLVSIGITDNENVYQSLKKESIDKSEEIQPEIWVLDTPNLTTNVSEDSSQLREEPKPKLKAFQSQTKSENFESNFPQETSLKMQSENQNFNSNLIMINKKVNLNKNGNSYVDITNEFELPIRTEVDKKLTDVEEDEYESDFTEEEEKYAAPHPNKEHMEDKWICKEIYKYNNPCADEIANIIK